MKKQSFKKVVSCMLACFMLLSTNVGLGTAYAVETNTQYSGNWFDYSDIIPSIEVYDKGISIKDAHITLEIGETYQAKAMTIIKEQYEGYYSNEKHVPVENTECIWESLTPSVATVSSDGIITGVGIGTGIIVATAEDGSTAECKVFIGYEENGNYYTFSDDGATLIRGKDPLNIPSVLGGVPVTEIGDYAYESVHIDSERNVFVAIPDSVKRIGKHAFYSNFGYYTETYKIDFPYGRYTHIVAAFMKNVEYIGENAFGYDYYGTFSNYGIDADFYKFENFTIYGEGSYAETYAYNEGFEFADIDSLSVNMLSTEKTAYRGDYVLLSLQSNASVLVNAKWSTSDSSVAGLFTVSPTQCKVKIKSVGTAIITAETIIGTVTCKIIVKRFPPTSIELSEGGSVRVGNSKKLVATFNSSDCDQTLTWKSSDENIATVDENGKVTALNPGIVTISATTINGLTADSIVTVTEKQNGFLYTLDNGYAVICKYVGAKTDLVIPETLDGYTVKGIGNSVFSGIATIKSIVVPDTVTTIGSETFYNCTALESITLSKDLTAIGEKAFGNCTALKNIELSDSVTSIGDNLFEGCTALEEIKGGDNIVSAGANTITDTAYYSNISVGEFGYIGNCICAYKYNSIPTIIYIPYGTKSVADDVFSNLSNYSVGGFIVPETVEKIGNISNSNLKYIYGVPDTYAQTYAETNNLYFFDITTAATRPTSIALSNTSKNLEKGDTFNLSITTEPENPITIYHWTSSNPDVAEVSQDGKVTAKGYGKAVITVTTSNGFTAECAVTVINSDSIIGDVNNDGKISLSDAVYVQRYLIGITTFNDTQLLMADVNGDGVVNLADGVYLQRKLLGV